MTDRDEMARVGSLMDARVIYVADGHHRLDVSYRLGVPYIPLYLTNMSSPGIVILPYHRMVKQDKKMPLTEMLRLLERRGDAKKATMNDSQSLSRILQEIASSPNPAFGLYSAQDPGSVYLLSVSSPKPEDSPLDRLRVNILHSGIAKDLLGIREEEISFTQDADELVASVKEGASDFGFLLPPTTTEEVKEVADHHLDMPPKSTFFYPKILTGLIYHKYA